MHRAALDPYVNNREFSELNSEGRTALAYSLVQIPTLPTLLADALDAFFGSLLDSPPRQTPPRHPLIQIR